jgi:hypothetical protein
MKGQTMKYKLFLLFAWVLLAGISTAHAQQCKVEFLIFPKSGNDAVNTPICLAASGQAARLRWDNAGSGLLQLFDTDDGGQAVWCAKDVVGNCAKGTSLCFQSDGDLVIYDGVQECTGNAVWHSGTKGDNVGAEGLGVLDSATDGEHAVIVTNFNTPQQMIVWQSANHDPS